LAIGRGTERAPAFSFATAPDSISAAPRKFSSR
jgi:hypothetical protein